MKTAEGRGRTLDEAVDAALIQLAESRRNVDVKVLSENSDETVVEVTVIGAGAAVPGSSSAAAATSTGGDVAEGAGKSQADNARDIVDQLLSKMGIRCQVTTRAEAVCWSKSSAVVRSWTGLQPGFISFTPHLAAPLAECQKKASASCP